MNLLIKIIKAILDILFFPSWLFIKAIKMAFVSTVNVISSDFDEHPPKAIDMGVISLIIGVVFFFVYVRVKYGLEFENVLAFYNSRLDMIDLLEFFYMKINLNLDWAEVRYYATLTYERINFINLWVKNTFVIGGVYYLFKMFYFGDGISFKTDEAAIAEKKKPSMEQKYKLRFKAFQKNAVYAGTQKHFKKLLETSNNVKEHLFVTEEMRSIHTHVLGPTGSGKTASWITPNVIQDMFANRPVVLIDAKGDEKLLNKIYSYQQKFNERIRKQLEKEGKFIKFFRKIFRIKPPEISRHNIKFVNLGDPSFSNTYNPILNGSAVEIRDRIMGAYEWANEYYKNRSSSVLLSILKGVQDVDKKITFKDLYYLLTQEKALKKLLKEVDDFGAKKQLEELVSNFKQTKEDCSGLISKMNDMAFGGLEHIVNTYNPDVELKDIYNDSDFVYFGLPANLIGETAFIFGKMLLMDLKATGSYVDQGKIEKKFHPVYIDEFDRFVIDEFITWLNKARSSGYAITMAHQSIGDLEAKSDAFAKRVKDNSNLKVFFRVDDHDAAKKAVEQLGTKTVLKKSTQFDIDGDITGTTASEIEEPIIHPNILSGNDDAAIKRGECLVYGKYPDFFNAIIVTDFLPDVDLIRINLDTKKFENMDLKCGLDIEGNVLGREGAHMDYDRGMKYRLSNLSKDYSKEALLEMTGAEDNKKVKNNKADKDNKGNKDNEKVEDNKDSGDNKNNKDNNGLFKRIFKKINKPSDNKPSDNKTSDNETSDNETSDNKPNNNKPSDNKPSDNKPNNNKTSDNKTSDNKTSDNKTSDNKPKNNKGLGTSNPVLSESEEVIIPEEHFIKEIKLGLKLGIKNAINENKEIKDKIKQKIREENINKPEKQNKKK